VTLIPALRDRVQVGAGPDEVRKILTRMPGDEALDVLTQASDLARAADQLRLLAAGVVATLSTPEHGHSGVAQSRGHRNPVSLVQQISGTTRTEAARLVRVGSDLVEGAIPIAANTQDPRVVDAPAAPDQPVAQWHAPLRDALLAGTITAEQHDAIRRGLGEPPTPADASNAVAAGFREAWSVAAVQLVDEALHRTVEELRSAARTIRDRLDPDGAEARFLERHAARSFRLWTDVDGRHHGSAVFDDEAFLWIQTVMNAALRPRRGGPRFIDAEERDSADSLAADPRTNDQLAHDLLLDILRAGALADSASVFGTRQAGVRIVHVADTGATHSEDGLVALSAPIADQHACDSGHTPVTVDAAGNALDVGREQRLFTAKQRVALAIRDGGCRWPSCDRPASYCEAHHRNRWVDGGRTDIDDGYLLCRFHHMNLHHHGWQIITDERGDDLLRHSSGRTLPLRRRLALHYAFADLDPPHRRFRPVA